MQAELVYLKAIPHLDRDGLILGDPLILWAKVCPRRPELMGEISTIVHEWMESELVISYESEEGAVLFFTGFAKNQGGMRYDREGVSTLPPPPGYLRTDSGLVPQTNTPVRQQSGVSPELVRSSDGISPSEDQHQYKINININKAMATVFACYEDNMPDAKRSDGKWKPIIRQELNELIRTHGADVVLQSINEAVTHGGKSIKYLRKVLENRANGIGPPSKTDPTGGAVWAAFDQSPPDYMRDSDD